MGLAEGLPLDSVFNLGRIWLGTSSRSASRLLLAPAIYIPFSFHTKGPKFGSIWTKHCARAESVPCPRLALGTVLGTVLTS